jgi:hypothetical protein
MLSEHFENCNYKILLSSLLKVIKIDDFKKIADTYSVERVLYNGLKEYINLIKGKKLANGDLLLTFPRFTFIEIINNFNIELPNNTWTIEPAIYKNNFVLSGLINMLPFQKNIVDTLIESNLIESNLNESNLNLKPFGVIIKLEAGRGKTYVALFIAQALKVKTLIIIPNKSLLGGWISAIAKVFNKDSVTGLIDLMVINSALKINLTDLKYGLVIYDETSMYCSEKRIPFLRDVSLNVKYIVGLTAEIDSRIDKKDIYTFAYIGSVFNCDSTMKTYSFPESDIILHKYEGPASHTKRKLNALMKPDIAESLNQLISDPYRNAYILQLLKSLISNNYNVFMFIDRVEHGSILYDAITKMNPDLKVGLITGLIPDSTRQEIFDTAQVIILTYGCGYRGLNIPRFDSMILCSPRKSYTYQTVKRVFRYMGSEKKRIIHDLIDMKSFMANQLKSRLNAYINPELKLTISSKKIKYNDPNLIDKDIFDLFI